MKGQDRAVMAQKWKQINISHRGACLILFQFMVPAVSLYSCKVLRSHPFSAKLGTISGIILGAQDKYRPQQGSDDCKRKNFLQVVAYFWCVVHPESRVTVHFTDDLFLNGQTFWNRVYEKNWHFISCPLTLQTWLWQLNLKILRSRLSTYWWICL